MKTRLTLATLTTTLTLFTLVGCNEIADNPRTAGTVGGAAAGAAAGAAIDQDQPARGAIIGGALGAGAGNAGGAVYKNNRH